MDVQIGKYIIDKKIGHGGMGMVFAAHSADDTDITPSSGKALEVALKTLTIHSEMPEERAQEIQRFDKEITALRMLDHPNIVHILGFGVQGEQMYYVMELVNGKSIHDILKTGVRFTWIQTLNIAKQLASAIASAHVRGIIHRDIKPGNILIIDPESESPTIKLTDFGIARVFSSQPLTDAGNVIGTLQFMSPEQALGQPITAQTDLYSIGAVLYTLMCGHAPFTGRTAVEIQRQHASEEYQPLLRDGSDAPIPAEFQAILNQLLEIDPNKRTPTAVALTRRLDSIEVLQDATILFEDSQLAQTEPEIVNLPAQPIEIKRDNNINTFVKVDRNAKPEHPTSSFSWIAAGFWILAFFGFVFVLAYFLQPVSADKLYNKINQNRHVRGDSSYLDMKTFQERFPDDSRCATIQLWREEYDVIRFQRRAQSRVTGTGSWTPATVLERQYYKAVQTADVSTNAALAELRAISDFYFIPPYSKTMGRKEYDKRICLLAVDNLTQQMEARLEEETKPLRESIHQRIEYAKSRLESEPEESKKIFNSIITLYQDDPNLADLVEQARALLK